MYYYIADRVQETTTDTGSGTLALLGASTGYRTFSTAIGNDNQTYYTIVNGSGTEWEVGIGYVGSDGFTFNRVTVLSSSTGGSIISFGAGTKNVFCSLPAEYANPTSQSGWQSYPVYASNQTIVDQSPIALRTDGTVDAVFALSEQNSTQSSSLFALSWTSTIYTAAAPIITGYNSFTSAIFYAWGNLSGGSYEFNTYQYPISENLSTRVNAFATAYNPNTNQYLITAIGNGGSATVRFGFGTPNEFGSGVSTMNSIGTAGKNIAGSTMGIAYHTTFQSMLTAFVSGINDLCIVKYYTPYNASNYTSPVIIGTVGAYSSASGYNIVCAYDETNGGTAVIVQDAATGVCSGFAINNQPGSTLPTASALVSGITAACYPITPESIAYSSVFGGLIFVVSPTAGGNPIYYKLTCTTSTLTASTSTTVYGPGFGQAVSSVAVTTTPNGSSGMFTLVSNAAVPSNQYWNLSFSVTSTTSLSTFSPDQQSAGGNVTPQWAAAVYNPLSTDYSYTSFYYNQSQGQIYQWGYRPLTTNNTELIGLAQTAVSASSGGGVQLKVAVPYSIAITANTSSPRPYTVGSKYYVTGSGSLTTVNSFGNVFVGKAISTTAIAVANGPGFSS